MNGVQKLTSATNTTSWGGGSFGGYVGSFAVLYGGWIGEAIFRSSWLSDAGGAAMDVLLKSKWGIP